MKPFVAFGLLLRFLWAVVVSGIDTIQVILRSTFAPGRAPRAGFVRFRYAPMSDQGAALLAAMITLTPGTTAIDIDPETRIMTLHLLDADGAEDAIADVRRTFEPPLVKLFGVPA
jgi:multicomponent K+:H+ antiporter subunit E/multicomponent Na+:H+ antiporter subunit E